MIFKVPFTGALLRSSNFACSHNWPSSLILLMPPVLLNCPKIDISQFIFFGSGDVPNIPRALKPNAIFLSGFIIAPLTGELLLVDALATEFIFG